MWNAHYCNSLLVVRGVVVAALVICFAIQAFAEADDAALKVAVDGDTYLVRKTAISREADDGAVDSNILAKARFTARVLDDQIVRSNFNKELFDPRTRAEVFFAQESGRLVPPWRKHLDDTSPTAVTDTKVFLKKWVDQIWRDPRELTLALAQEDYRDGLTAYRENAAIYFDVVRRGQILTYEAALLFMQNEWPTLRLAVAKSAEDQLNQKSSAVNVADTAFDELRANCIGEMTSSIERARTVGDLEDSVKKMRETVERGASRLSGGPLKDYLRRIAELSIKFELGAAAYGLRQQ